MKRIVTIILVAVVILSTFSGCQNSVGLETRSYNKVIRGFKCIIPMAEVYAKDLIDEVVEGGMLTSVDVEYAEFYTKRGESDEERLKNDVLFIISFYLIDKILKKPFYGDGEMSCEDFRSAYDQILYYDKGCFEFYIWFASVINTAKEENRVFDLAKAVAMAEIFEAERTLHPETSAEDIELFFVDWNWFSQTTLNLSFQSLLYRLAGNSELANEREVLDAQIRDMFHNEILKRGETAKLIVQ